MTDVYAGLEPRELWRHFGALNGIPRPSGKEAAARDYVLRIAESVGAESRVDARGNAIVRLAAMPGCEGAPSVAVQAHLDMVCERRPEIQHDFERDPIRPRVEGDRVFATGTTLGADNGIGAAAALALLTSRDLVHGPLELLFTVEEETGLHGAAALDPAVVRSRLLINLDSEDPKVLTVGCAGGAGATLRVPAGQEPAPPGWVALEIRVSGLKGGHSGVQIHQPLANAIKLLTRALVAVTEAGIDYRLSTVRGGNAHNAIPRDASAVVALSQEAVVPLETALSGVRSDIAAEWQADEPGFALDVLPAPAPAQVLGAAEQERLVALLVDLPHGVIRMSTAFHGKVETSSNLAKLGTEDGRVVVATSSRSFVDDELQKVLRGIAEAGDRAGAEVEVRQGYGGWEPNPSSRLLRVAERVYRETFGRPAEVEVIHAGLECGIIVSRLEGMDAISFGPRIEGAHTPEEHVYISTVESTWRLLTALIAALASGAP